MKDEGGQIGRLPLAATAADDAVLAPFGGEFVDPAIEDAYQAEHAGETARHARIVLAASVVLNTVFLASDWRFAGTAHFWVAVPARLGVIATALACLWLVRRWPSRTAIQRTMVAWMILTALGVGALVTARTDIALFVAMMLPSIFWLGGIASSFRWTAAGGVFCSLIMLAGYGDYGGGSTTGLGLLLAMAILNTSLALVVTRANRLARRTWVAVEGQRRLSEALARQRLSLERVFAACPVPLILTAPDDGRVLGLSDSCAELLGSARPATLREFYASPGDEDGLVHAIEEGGGEAEFETPVRLATGAERTLLVKAATIQLDGEDVIMSGLLDITERKAAQTSLELLASTDALTGLRNRLSFFSAGRAEMLRAARSRTMLALLMVDIDHFKQINDTRGHLAGDATLRAFAALCIEQLGRRAVVGRLGGEEFGVLLPQTGPEAAALVAESLREQVEALVVAMGEERPVRLTVSIGVAGVRAGDRDIDGALARADLALYAAKRGGRNRVVGDESDATQRRTG